MHKYFAVIPARKNSKGIKHKNLQKIGQRPMLQYTLEAAKTSRFLDYIILSSDDPEAISLAGRSAIPAPFIRPDELSRDNSKSDDVFIHALNWYKAEFDSYPDNIVALQPTSPFRTGMDIDNAIKQYKNVKTNSLISVSEATQHPSDCITLDDRGRITRVQLEVDKTKVGRQAYQQAYFIDGGIYISSVRRFLQERTMFDNHSAIYIVNRSHAIDVDHLFDLEIARAMYTYNNESDTELFNL